ncbi:MAG: DUF1624 domain-containing protein, partial [Acidobacteriales bacterium]|nr:DUF1624 domain-containing protein [Terriglobales bacterium]
MCLDIYRGLCVAGMILVDNPGNDTKAYWPIMHAQWNGWTPADFIFPSFLFLVGVSIAFSFSSRLQRGESRTQILFHVFKRSLILIAIGLFVNASPLIGFDLHSFRFLGVTQRIALCYLAAAILEDGYLLHSPNPYRLWFRVGFNSGVKDPSQGNGLGYQRLLHEAEEELA